MCYELHYRGFAGVDPDWEWNPALLALRGELERVFLAGVRRDVGPIAVGSHGGRRNGRHLGRTRRRHRPVVLPARHRNLAADARILRAPVGVSPQRGRSARVGDPATDGCRESGVRGNRIRRVRRRAGPTVAPAAVRRSDGGRGSGRHISGVPGRGTRRSVGGGEPDVLVRTAPPAAWRRDRALRVDGDHLPAGIPPDGAGPATHGGTVSLRRVLRRTRRGRRGARTSRAHRRGRGSHRQGTAARARYRVRDPRARRGRKPLGGPRLWRRGSRAGRRCGGRWTSRPALSRFRHLRWLVSHKRIFARCAGRCRSPP